MSCTSLSRLPPTTVIRLASLIKLMVRRPPPVSRTVRILLTTVKSLVSYEILRLQLLLSCDRYYFCVSMLFGLPAVSGSNSFVHEVALARFLKQSATICAPRFLSLVNVRRLPSISSCACRSTDHHILMQLLWATTCKH